MSIDLFAPFRIHVLTALILPADAMRMGPGKHLHGLTLPGGIKGEDFTYLHELVVVQELARIGAPGYMAGLNAGQVIGLPPVLNYGTDKMKAEVLPEILA